MNDRIQSSLESIQKAINDLYGFHDGIQRINYGPCGVFAKIFYDEWNAPFSQK